jgi:hypothetical protein
MLLRYVLLRALELAVEGESTAHPPCVPMFMDLETVRKASGG